jgi:hypothetical protein
MSQLEGRAVSPFYLQMMGLNACDRSPELWSELVAAGAEVGVDDVRWLLNVSAWRPVLMGAWFSTRFTAAEIGSALRQAMTASQGSLTAPPLAVACAVVAGADALPEMRSYVESDPGRDGSTAFVSAGIEHLGGASPVAVTDRDRRAWAQLLDVANRLGVALKESGS